MFLGAEEVRLKRAADGGDLEMRDLSNAVWNGRTKPIQVQKIMKALNFANVQEFLSRLESLESEI